MAGETQLHFQHHGIYTTAPAPGNDTSLLYVRVESRPPAKLPLSQAFTSGGYIFVRPASGFGWASFDWTAFSNLIRLQIGNFGQPGFMFAWIDPLPQNGIYKELQTLFTLSADQGGSRTIGNVSNSNRELGPVVPFGFRNSRLTIQQGCSLGLNHATTPTGFTIAPQGSRLVKLTQPDVAATAAAASRLNPTISAVALQLGGDREGDFQFDVELTESDLDDLDVGLRYFWGETPSADQSIQYPVFELGSAGTVALQANLSWFQPTNAERTYYELTSDAPLGSYFRQPLGGSVSLTPMPCAGSTGMPRLNFTNKPGPAGTSSSEPVYLVPSGRFAVGPSAGWSDFTTPNDAAVLEVMCGLTGTEFLLATQGATMDFVEGQPALAKGFSLSTGDPSSTSCSADPCKPGGGTPVVSGGLFDDTFTTARLKLNAPSGANGIDATTAAAVSRGYAIQPETSPFYSQGSLTYPLAVGSQVSTSPAAVPMVPYAGLQDGGPTAATVQAFEQRIIAPTRFSLMPKDGPQGPIFFDPLTREALSGYSRTPEGLLLELSDEGSWNTLQIAKSPLDKPGPEGRLAVVGDPAISPDLSYALMNDSLFMVVTNATAFGTQTSTDPKTTPPPPPPVPRFENEIQVGEWTFRLDVGATSSEKIDKHTILVFKFTTAACLVDLIADAANWQETPTFTTPVAGSVETADGDGAPSSADRADAFVAATQAYLMDELCTAKTAVAAQSGSVFQNIWEKANDPEWTGMIAFNCGLDTGDLPSDLQDLLGGIDGQLRAHHFGVTVNQVTAGDAPKIKQSSIFALIHYEKDYTPPQSATATAAGDPPAIEPGFAFQVLKLDVLIENSAMAHFDAKIAMTIPTLFGQAVTLLDSPHAGHNVIEIDGSYQKHGDTGRVVFDTTTPFVFTVDGAGEHYRVLEEIQVTDAQLVPVGSSQRGGCGGDSPPTGSIAVHSTFGMSGVLLFNSPDQSKKAVPDPFSYGDSSAAPPTGLPFAEYDIDICTVITNNTGAVKKLLAMPGGVVVQSDVGALRPNGLVNAMPLKLIGFEGWSNGEAQPTGWPVTVDGDAHFSTNAFTASFGLRYQLSLGSLGSLSSLADSFDVELVMGWTPGGSGADDQAWLLIVPPKILGGGLGFGLQGVLATTFVNVELDSVFWPTDQTKSIEYAILLNGVDIELLGLSLTKLEVPSAVGFTIFAKPRVDKNGHPVSGGGRASNLGWLVSGRVPKPGGVEEQIGGDSGAASDTARDAAYEPEVGDGAGATRHPPEEEE